MEREVALEVTNILTQQRPEDIDSEVIDAIGELTNMIAGGAKPRWPTCK